MTIGFCKYFLVLEEFMTLFFHNCHSLIFSAFVGTSLAFACFSGAALVAKRREYLYLGGLVSSGLSILLWLHFASSIFGGSTALFKFEVMRLPLIFPPGITFWVCGNFCYYAARRFLTHCLVYYFCSCILGFWCLWVTL